MLAARRRRQGRGRCAQRRGAAPRPRSSTRATARSTSPATRSSASALVAAAERLATASAKLDRPATTTRSAPRGSRSAGSKCCAGSPRPAPTTSCGSNGSGARGASRIAPVAAGETIGNSLLAWRPVIAVSATLGGEPPFPALACQMGFRSDAEPGGWGDPDDVENGNGDDDGRPVARAGRGYVALQTASSFDWRDAGDPLRRQGPARSDAGAGRLGGRRRRSPLRARERGRRSRARAVHVARQRHALRRRAARAHRPRHPRPGRARRRTPRGSVHRRRDVGARRHAIVLGRHRRGRRRVRPRRDRPHPVPGAGRTVARTRGARARASAALNAFNAIDLPVAALVLAQGAGRLIRTATDRGVVAVLDPRLATRPYRVQLLAAMPPLRRCIDLADACALLEELAAASPPPRRIADLAAPPPADGAEQPASELRTDLSSSESVGVRNLVACPVCAAEIGARLSGQQRHLGLPPRGTGAGADG